MSKAIFAPLLFAAATSSSLEEHISSVLTDEAVLTRPLNEVITDELIEAWNSEPGSNWVAGRNSRFDGFTVADFKALSGVLISNNTEDFPPYKEDHLPWQQLQAFASTSVAMEEEFDWRADKRAAGCHTVYEVLDQAQCGSCWAFATTAVMSDRLCIHSQGKVSVRLSPMDELACNNWPNMKGCLGGLPVTAYTFYKYKGVVDGGAYDDVHTCWPYEFPPCSPSGKSWKYSKCPRETAETPECLNYCPGNAASFKESKHYGLGGYGVCKSDADCATAMAEEIYKQGPIVGTIFVQLSWSAYKTGVWKKKEVDANMGPHAIKIIGFGHEGGEAYWLIANSWNDEWGDKGFGKVLRGHNHCEIENAIFNGGPIAGLPKLGLANIVV